MLGGQKRDCKWMQMLPRDDLYIYIYIYMLTSLTESLAMFNKHPPLMQYTYNSVQKSSIPPSLIFYPYFLSKELDVLIQ